MDKQHDIKVSVVIPVYNAGLFLEECLNSVCEQTFTDLEIICVDDGSSDESIDIIKVRQKEDHRIRCFSQNHQFAGAARNKGLDEAKGKYVLFLDADDFIEKDMIHDLYEKAEVEQADIVLCGAYRYDNRTGIATEQKHWLQTDNFPGDVFSRKDLGDKLFSITNNAVWNKLFSRRFITDQKIRFQAIHNSNDMYFMAVSLACADRIAYVDHPYVYYRVNTNDNIQTKKRDHPLDFLNALEAIEETLTDKGVYKDLQESYRHRAAKEIHYNMLTVDDKARETIAETLKNSELLKELMKDDASDPVLIKINKLMKGTDLVRRYRHAEDDPVCLKETEIKDPECTVIICCKEGEDIACKRVINQTGGSCNIIIVGCIPDKMLSLSENDKRITLIRMSDCSRSVMRNVALDHADGTYLYFADSRLLLPETALESMINKCETEKLDLLFIGDTNLKVKDTDGVSLVAALIDAQAYEGSLGAQLISRQFLEKFGNRFTCNLSDDASFTYRNILQARKTGYLEIESIRKEDDPSCSYQDMYDHFNQYLAMRDLIRNADDSLPNVIMEMPFKEKEKAAAIYELLPNEERIDQETMDPYTRKAFREEIIKPYKQKMRIADEQNKSASIREKYEKILGSRTYRLASLLAWLPRKLKKLLRINRK